MIRIKAGLVIKTRSFPGWHPQTGQCITSLSLVSVSRTALPHRTIHRLIRISRQSLDAALMAKCKEAVLVIKMAGLYRLWHSVWLLLKPKDRKTMMERTAVKMKTQVFSQMTTKSPLLPVPSRGSIHQHQPELPNSSPSSKKTRNLLIPKSGTKDPAKSKAITSNRSLLERLQKMVLPPKNTS